MIIVLVWHEEIEPFSAPLSDTASLDPVRVETGARIALLGNCAGCHTISEGEALSGGLAIDTPFGAIHSTNMSPDPDTGIGETSHGVYARAMREGVDREGRRLYPAFANFFFQAWSEYGLTPRRFDTSPTG